MATNGVHLAIILGAPASGKTTLARRLSADLGVTTFSKDDVKEALFDVLECTDRDTSRRLSEASFAVLARLARTQLAAGRSCIVEGNWRAPHARMLRDIVTDNAAHGAQICCRAEPQEIVRRFTLRRRHAGHLDALLPFAEFAAAAAGPPAFLEVNGPRWIYRSDAPEAYAQLLEDVQCWRV